MFESKKNNWLYFIINIIYIVIGIIAVSATGFISSQFSYVMAGLLYIYSILKILQFFISAEYKLGYYKSLLNFILAICGGTLCLLNPTLIVVLFPLIVGIMASLSGVVGLYISIVNGYMKSDFILSLFDSICFIAYGIILLSSNASVAVEVGLFGAFMIVRGILNAFMIAFNLIKNKKIQNN